MSECRREGGRGRNEGGRECASTTLDLSVGSTSASALISRATTWSNPPEAAQSMGVHRVEFLV